MSSPINFMPLLQGSNGGGKIDCVVCFQISFESIVPHKTVLTFLQYTFLLVLPTFNFLLCVSSPSHNIHNLQMSPLFPNKNDTLTMLLRSAAVHSCLCMRVLPSKQFLCKSPVIGKPETIKGNWNQRGDDSYFLKWFVRVWL